MKDGFIKAAAGTIDVVVADVQYNTEQILARMREADAAGVNLLTLPELCLTGYTCGDLFSPTACSARSSLRWRGSWRRRRTSTRSRRSGFRFASAENSITARQSSTQDGCSAWCRRRICRITANSMSCGSFPPRNAGEKDVYAPALRPERAVWNGASVLLLRDAGLHLRRGALRGSVGSLPAVDAALRGRRSHHSESLRLRRSDRQGRVPPVAGRRDVGAAGLRLCLLQRVADGIDAGHGLLAAPSDRGKRDDPGRKRAVCGRFADGFRDRRAAAHARAAPHDELRFRSRPSDGRFPSAAARHGSDAAHCAQSVRPAV